MADTLPLETLYRLYKAETGDIIDDIYMKMTGVFNTESASDADENGVIHRKMNYTMAINHLSLAKTYYVVWDMQRAPTAGDDAYLEPFVDASITDYPTTSYRSSLNAAKCYRAW